MESKGVKIIPGDNTSAERGNKQGNPCSFPPVVMDLFLACPFTRPSAFPVIFPVAHPFIFPVAHPLALPVAFPAVLALNYVAILVCTRALYSLGRWR